MNSGSRKGRKGRKGDAFYLPLSTWRPWREVLGFFHAKVAKDGTRWAEMPALHSAKSGEEFRTIDILVLGDCAEEGGQSADA